MKFSYDPRHNVAYFKFQARQADVDPIQASGKLVIATTLGGNIFSIKLRNANEQLASEGSNFLKGVNILVNGL